MNDKRERITIELRGHEIPNLIRTLDFATSTILAEIPDALYNIKKIMMRIESALHKAGQCDAEKFGDDCAFQGNIVGFQKEFQKEIAKDPDFKEGGEDSYILEMFGVGKKK